MTEKNTKELAPWGVRAVAWELLALSFHYPDTQLAEAVASGEWQAAAQEIAEAASLDIPEGWSSGLSTYVDTDDQTFQATANTLMHTLRQEATLLFVGAPHPRCSPFEGVWRAEADGVAAMLFVNPRSMEVERSMSECGLGRPKDTNEPLDHVSTECEFMQYLTALAAGAQAPEGIVVAACASSESAIAAYRMFFVDHASTWMPQFAEAVLAEAQEPFYRAAATLLKAMIEQENAGQ